MKRPLFQARTLRYLALTIGFTALMQTNLDAWHTPDELHSTHGHIDQIDSESVHKLKARLSNRGCLGQATNESLETCCNTSSSGPVCRTEPVTDIGQSDIPLHITCPGYYRLVEDITFDGAQDDPTLNPNPITPGYGPIAIGINAPGVILDLNGHSINYKGFGTNAIIVYDTLDVEGNIIGTGAGATIKNGSIFGNLDTFTAGVAILSDDVTTSRVHIDASEIGIVLQQVNWFLNTDGDLVGLDTQKTQSSIILDGCYLTSNFIGLWGDNLSNDPACLARVVNCSFEGNINGVLFDGSFFGDNCTILNSLENGIKVSGPNSNIHNCNIINSGTNGLLITKSANTLVTDSQVVQSGADGIIVGERHGYNVQFDRVQVANANGILLRVENMENFLANDCQFANSIQNPLPNNSPANPLVRIEDVFNATLNNCQMASTSGTSEGCLIRNSQGVICDNCCINITSIQSAIPLNGITFQGDVLSSKIQNCTLDGYFSKGISLERDEFNGANKGVVLENNIIEGAQDHGIYISEATGCVVQSNIVSQNEGNGITLTRKSSDTLVQQNTLMNNKGTGLLNKGCANQIFSNIASNNCKNYAGVCLVSNPGRGIGVLDNISSKKRSTKK